MLIASSSLRVNIYSKLPYYTPFVTVNGKRVEKADVEASNGVTFKIISTEFLNMQKFENSFKIVFVSGDPFHI